MNDINQGLRLALWGTFRLHRRDGQRLTISSRKGMALLAMLATAPDGERTRSWLQDRLWGSRGKVQAQQSLRRELAGLKTLLGPQDPPLLTSTAERVKLDLRCVEIDRSDQELGATFLEGLDIPGEEGFEDWLRGERAGTAIQTGMAQHAEHLPSPIVDVHAPTPGFGGKPALAIMPLDNDTDDPEVGYWAEGISEDLIELLSRLRWLPVIATSTMAQVAPFDSSSMGIGQIVGAGYILRGRIARDRSGHRLHLQLVESARGHILWSDQFALTPDDPAQVLGDLVHRVVAILSLHIESAEQLKSLDKPLEALASHELIWRSRFHMKRFTKLDAQIARDALAQAQSLFPNSPEVLIQLGWAKAWDVWAGRLPSSEIDEFRSIALRARDCDPFDGRAYMLLGMADLWQRRFATARNMLEEAVRLNPSLINAYGNLGSVSYLSGEPERALAPLTTGLRLSPYDAVAFYMVGELAVSYLMLGDFEKAIESANGALSRRPAYFYAHLIKITALDCLGDRTGANAALANFRSVRPNFTGREIDWVPFKDEEWPQRFRDAMSRAES
jgi:TolB-like protein